jgi:hypothetical protein
MGTFGGLSVVIGLFASAVATWFFALGLQATEPDDQSRNALIAAGVLLTACQLIAFSTTELLPEGVLTRQRWRPKALAALLFCFEVMTMAITQLALVQVADVQASADGTRAAELRTQLDRLRSTAAGLRENGEIQSRSKLPQSRAAGAAALRQAVDVERDIGHLASELAKVESDKRPTLTSLLGPERTTWFVVLRSALVALAGLVMVSWGSSLIAEARRAGHAVAAPQETGSSPAGLTVHQPAPGRLVPQWRPAAEPPPAISSPMPAVTLALPAASSHPVASWTQHSAALQLSHPNCVPPVAAQVTPDATPVPAEQLEQEREERTGRVAPVTPAAASASFSDSVGGPTGPAIGAAGGAVVDLASPWKVRTLAPLYPVVFFDGQQVKVYGEGGVRSRYAYVALGAQLATGLQPLGIWIEHTVGATLWLTIFEDLKARGLERIQIAVADDFVGLSAALRDVFPAATPQTCIAHLVRDSLDCAIPKDRKAPVRVNVGGGVNVVQTHRHEHRQQQGPGWTARKG